MISKIYRENRQYFLGGLFFVGLFFPLFGQSVNFGLHSRIISQLFLLLSVALGLINFKITIKTLITAALIFLYVVLIMFYSQGERQLDYLLSIIIDKDDYRASKLSLFVQTTFVPLLAGFVLSSYARDKRFLMGMTYASLAMSLVAIFVGLKYSHYWFGGGYQVSAEWKESAVFSSISMTILHLAGFIAALEYSRSSKSKKFLLVFALMNFVFIVIYQQRTAWVYVVFVVVYTSFRREYRANIWRSGFKFCVVLALIAIAIYIMGRLGFLNERLLKYASQMNSLDLFASRSNYFEFAWQGFLDTPMGHGWGEYSVNGPFRYPHNVILEALYELGVIGGSIIIALLAMMALSVKGLLSTRFGNSTVGLTMGLLFGYLLVFALKAGDLNSLNIQLALALLFANYRRVL